MNIIKLILLACPAFLVSMLLVVNPANASSLKSTYATQIVTVVSTQQIPDLVTPNLIQTSNSIIDQLGCNCANCVQAKFQSLQGKLPSVSF
ncbi:hypothetical protein [Nostoc sp. 'Lobaria pulmonaria (5183) cyanobiont']|uniref:hypothetical protein n=1 Tax=Nostoc sp. 'Lobaria pulmonaria (5183) cyanobiont' TaxID=1618022 RepID=UPI000CF3336F|nr:hypothetical protein [Nostoc sp. 'Lobaria pulmonaria (5183) cyanobiont']AVH72016.1 hypothetical protein NLP_3467 [Nostoc sp. 'Lobaria pulmonaria (5183) cyanobiont']